MDFLTITPPDGRRVRREIGSGTLRIGRSSSNDLVLEDLNISRVHAELVRRPEGLYVRDAGGKNGTFVNDRRIEEPILLRPGDTIRVGTTSLVFNADPKTSIEFSDRPLEAGSTTVLQARSVRTPSPGEIPLILEADTPGRGSAGEESRERLAPAAINLIFEADRELVFHRPLPELLETIMDLAHRSVPYERGLLMLLEDGKPQAQVVRVPPDEAGSRLTVSRTITDRVINAQDSVLPSDALLDDRFREGQSIAAQQLRSVMCVPLWNNREVIGLIYVDSRHRAGLFTENDLRVLTHLAHVAAVKIENARLFEHAIAAETMRQELDRAAEIQNHLLPQEGPAIEGYGVDGGSRSCHAVGGDYFDYIPLPGGRYAVMVGDVAGKGLPAALLMCSFQAGLHALADLDLPADQTLLRLNRFLCHHVPTNRYVTFFYGVLDPARHLVTYTNAGHNPPLLLRANGQPERLGSNGPPLGLFEGLPYGSGSVEMRPGDVLVCYSDGVTESQSPEQKEFGEERLIETVRRLQKGSSSDIYHGVVSAVDDHRAGSPHLDDLTLVVLRRNA